MKRTVASLVLAVLFVSMLVLGVASKMQAQNTQGQCSAASLNGTYGILSTGFFQGTPPTNIVPTAPAASNPFAQVGTISFNGVGGAVGHFTFSFNGMISGTPPGTPDTEFASYTVNPDCTGTVTVTGTGAGSANIVIVAQGKEVFVMLTNMGQVATGIAIRQ